METVEFPDLLIQQQFRDLFLHKYENRKPDVIISVRPSYSSDSWSKYTTGSFRECPLFSVSLMNFSVTSPSILTLPALSARSHVARRNACGCFATLPDTQHVVVAGDKQSSTDSSKRWPRNN